MSNFEDSDSRVQSSIFEKLKEVGRHTVIYGMGSALQAVVGFILIPIYTKYYTPEIYGVLALLLLCASLAAACFFLGGSSSLSRSYYDYPDPAARKKAIGVSLAITSAGAGAQILFAVLLCGLLSKWLFGTPHYAPHVLIVLCTSALAFTNALFYLLLKFARKSTQVVAINIISLVLGIALILYFLVVLNLGIWAPILGEFLNQCFLCGFLFWLTRDQLEINWHRPELIAQLKYGLPTMLAGLAFYLLTWADRLLLKHYTNFAEVGIYSLGYRLGTSIYILFIIPFGQIWAPMRMQYRNETDAHRLYTSVLTYYFMIGLTIAALIGTFSRELLLMLARRPEYLPAARVIALVMLAHLLYGSVNIIDSGIVFSRRTILHVYIFGSCIPINLLLNVLLIPRYGALGAAWAALATFALLVVIVFVISNHLFRVEVEFSRLVRLFLAASAVLLTSQLLPTPGLATFICKSGLMLGMLVFIFAAVLSSHERAHLSRLSENLKRRLGKRQLG
jgi:O-antigen/teichoic acid export membrane protein